MHLKEKEHDFWKPKNIIYELDTAIKKSQVHQWSLKIKIYMIYLQKHFFELIYERRKINSNCK